MKPVLKFAIPPTLLLVGLVAAYLRRDVVASYVLGGVLLIWLLVVWLRTLVRPPRPSTIENFSNAESKTESGRVLGSAFAVQNDSVEADTGQVISDRIRWVASSLSADLSEFRDRAKTVAGETGPASVDQLIASLHAEHNPPPDLQASFPGLGQWIAARQFAVFEILYNLGRPAIPAIKRIAFGEYDWTQGNALEVLCRFAADGIDSEDIIDELLTHLPSMRDEAHYYAIGPILNQCESNPALRIVLDRLLVVPEFQETYERIINPDQ